MPSTLTAPAPSHAPAASREASQAARRREALALDQPRPRWQHEILELLLGWGYDDHGIDCVFTHLSIFGSAEGNPHLGYEERPIVEALLPWAAESEWAEYDQFRVAITEG